MSKVITGAVAESRGAAATDRKQGGFEWGPLAGLAIVFALVALADIGLTFVPFNFGNAEWEFGTATSVLNNLPLAVVGIGLLAVAGLGRRTEPLVKVALGLSVGLTVLLLVVAFMFARHTPTALQSVEAADPVIKQGLQESVLRSAVQLAGYFAATVWMATRLRRLLRGDE